MSEAADLDAEAAAYVITHNLEQHLSAAVDHAIQQRADNPLLLISEYLARLAVGGGGAPSGGPAAAEAMEMRPVATPTTLPLHSKARSQDNPQYPERFAVSDEQVRWSAPYTGYAPPTWTHKAVADNARGLPTGQGWADPDDPIALRDELRARTTFTTEGGVACSMGEALRWDAQSGAPLNPCGRTGLAGRGLLGKWGANHAADPIVTRFDPESGRLQVVAIQRRDTKQWALPGGMVDPGEAVSVTVQREFSEEAGELTDPAERLRFEQLTKELFGSGKQVYRGYVDDPRNSDNAWMETTAFHFHCSDEIGRMLPLEAGDDAQRVMWLDVSLENEKYRSLYASHRELVDGAVFAAWKRTDLGGATIVHAAVPQAAGAEEDEMDADASA